MKKIATKDTMKEEVTNKIEQAISHLQENKENITHVFCVGITKDEIHIDMSITRREFANALYNLAKYDEEIREIIEQVNIQLDREDN